MDRTHEVLMFSEYHEKQQTGNKKLTGFTEASNLLIKPTFVILSKCPFCEYKTADRDFLAVHIENTHARLCVNIKRNYAWLKQEGFL